MDPHSLQIYSSDDFLTEEVARYFRAGLHAGDVCMGVATGPHRRALVKRLGADASRVTLFDAEETLARFDDGRRIDRSAFRETIGRDVERAALGGRRVRAFGEMVTLLAADERSAAVLDLEALWTDMIGRTRLDVLCTYPLEVFDRAAGGELLRSVCSLHPQVHPIEARRPAAEHAQDPRPRASRAVVPGTVPRRVLVVDDDPRVAESLSRWLRAGGHTVQVVTDGAAAIAEVVRSRPDIVLLDIAMPAIDGYEVVRRLRALPALHSCVFVALTGLASPEDVARAERAGFDHHLAKPPDFHRLEALLRSGV